MEINAVFYIKSSLLQFLKFLNYKNLQSELKLGELEKTRIRCWLYKIICTLYVNSVNILFPCGVLLIKIAFAFYM